MFGLTTNRRLRATEARLATTGAQLAENDRLLIEAYGQVITEQSRAERDHSTYRGRLTRALHACARYRSQIPNARRIEHPDELWSLIDWSLWGSGMGDTFREQLADRFLAAITPQQHDQALRLIAAWTDRGRLPLGRRRYEDQQNRLDRALRAVARWRAEAARSRRTAHLLAEQLLDATSGQNTAARVALGLDTSPWQRAVDGLNALIDSGVPFHIEPDGHISNPAGDEHIEYDLLTKRWRLVHDADDEPRSATDA